ISPGRPKENETTARNASESVTTTGAQSHQRLRRQKAMSMFGTAKLWVSSLVFVAYALVVISGELVGFGIVTPTEAGRSLHAGVVQIRNFTHEKQLPVA